MIIYYNNNMNLHKILIFSSCLFLLPYLNIVLFIEETTSNFYEKYMSMLLVCNFIFSVCSGIIQ